MNFMENQAKWKDDIKSNFLSFFKIEYVAHLATQKLKDIKQVPGELVREYDKDSKIYWVKSCRIMMPIF